MPPSLTQLSLFSFTFTFTFSFRFTFSHSQTNVPLRSLVLLTLSVHAGCVVESGDLDDSSLLPPMTDERGRAMDVTLTPVTHGKTHYVPDLNLEANPWAEGDGKERGGRVEGRPLH